MNTISWNLIDKYFKDNPNNLVAHHLDSYNDFFSIGIFQIFKENNPIRFIQRKPADTVAQQQNQITYDINDDANKNDVEEADVEVDVESDEDNLNTSMFTGGARSKSKPKPKSKANKNNKNNIFQGYECLIYLGGKTGDKIYFGKPIIYDNEQTTNNEYAHFMYPNDARLRNMTYGTTIHYDIDVEYIIDTEIKTFTYKNIYLGKFPIMLHSNLCILKGLTTNARFNMGECRNDYGGYFIINGKEKVIICQEKFGDNMLYIKKYKKDEPYSYSCEIHSVSEDSSKPIRYTSVKLVSHKKSNDDNDDNNNENNIDSQIVVDIPNVKKPIPLFILMRALGIISDKNIIEYCLLDLEQNSNMIDLFIPSIHDAQQIFTQELALDFIKSFTKRQSVTAVQDILINYFLPHIGEDNYLNKAYFIGFMVNKLLRVYTKQEPPTDRDNFKFKRIETSGVLIHDLFRQYYLLQKHDIFLEIDREYYYSSANYNTKHTFINLVEQNLSKIFKNKIVESGLNRAFKGNWGAIAYTQREGIVQDLNRLSWFSHISHLRKINLPLDRTAKVVGPHQLHSTQWGFIDPVDTPDGENIGLHKHLSISTVITNKFPSDLIASIKSGDWNNM